MILPWALSALGLVILLLAGDALVKGAVNLSLRAGIPALIVSLTIVSFGTSAPELFISINAVLSGKAAMALGNVVGSNTANILLVLGVPAMISGIAAASNDYRKSFVMMIGATLIFIGLAFRGVFDIWAGLVLLAGLAYMLSDAFRDTRKHRRASAAVAALAEEDVEGADPDMPWWQIGVFLALGLVGLPLGADLLVDNAAKIAEGFGISEAVIGLTLVALGTSLPELATTVMAALRRQAEVAIGNVLGSNMFNLLAIIGLTTLVGPIPVDAGFLRFDLWVMLAASLLLIPFVFFKMPMGRLWGLALTVLYVAYVIIVLG